MLCAVLKECLGLLTLLGLRLSPPRRRVAAQQEGKERGYELVCEAATWPCTPVGLAGEANLIARLAALPCSVTGYPMASTGAM